MKNKIIISKPYIKECESDIFGKVVRLCADVTMKNPNSGEKETKECYFEFEKEYKKYLVADRSDAFVMGLLITAMENNMDIEFEEPISERLYYQLTTYYIPMMAKYNPNYPLYDIHLIGKYTNECIKNEGAVATGCSGGVDSFYTILHHGDNCEVETNKLTHIVFSSSGTADMVEERIKAAYVKTLPHIRKIASECNLSAIACYNNLYQFYKFPYKGFNMLFTTTFGAVAYALQKLIAIYYASSGDPITYFNMDMSKTSGHDSSVIDVFTVSCMNTENLTFYSSGTECDRIEKEDYISDYEPAQKLLIVCAQEVGGGESLKGKYKNCSHCPKCLRTMAQFYSLNKLENFGESFDVNGFLKNKSKSLGKMMGLNKSSYVNDMKKFAKKNGVKIPFTAYLYKYFWYKPIKILRKIFSKSLIARKIYYKLNLDYKLDGYRGSKYEAYKDKI